MSYSTFPRGFSDKPPTYTITQLPEVEGTLGIFSVLKSDPPTAYTVMVTFDQVTCDCPDFWKWGVEGKVKNYACKHIKMVAEKVTADKRPPAGSKRRAKPVKGVRK